ncbi:pectin lyase fold/virulence factor [Alternaria rosae]|uniref:pectin lyase fold/virulence factor n=1 Tax=Alternaria rosae TaxID=1187941 RepID=UPI001E8DB3BF|nr:pectin lyase fold/virulence factor [Alternaria rosae]KAH6868796.1 pectin lyase fold/virulence factor [Alternaria rosae]
MRFEFIALLAVAASSSAQSVIGTAYGYGAGATGGGDAAAVTPTSNEELEKYLSDDTERVILLTQQFDFTGKTASGAGCDKSTCSAKSGGGQYYLGDLSCGGSDMTPVSSITYDAAGTTALKVGSNKSILGVGGKGVIKGKGLSIAKDASNVIIQGVEFTTINPGIVWGGDALDMQGGNTKIWVDHCKFSLVGRMFVVSHYDGSEATLSNNEFDGVTTTSATCNDNHYWTMMMIGKTEKFTLDKNYFHDVSGRAPKLGQDGVNSYFHAVNNYFENMKGHAFDAYTGVNALVEGNAFVAVDQPNTEHAAGIATFVSKGGDACSSVFGRACLENSVDSSSGELSPGSSSGFIAKLGKIDIPEPMEASKVAAYVKANAGPANLRTSSSSVPAAEKVVDSDAAASVTKPVVSKPTSTSSVIKPKPVATTTAAAAPAPAAPTGSNSSAGAAKLYAQCGGQGFTGPTKCESPATCVKSNEWYSQCINSSSKFRRALGRYF